MPKIYNSTVAYIKRAVWLIPILLTTLFCMYFINLFHRIDEALMVRQHAERDTIIEFAHFIKTKKTLYTYLDIIDRFDDNNLYLLDENLKPLSDRRHTNDCWYCIYDKQHPYRNNNVKKILNADLNSGTFKDKVIPGKEIDYKFRKFTTEGTNYVLLTGVHQYPKLPEEKELQWAIGLLLLFTAVCNWIILAYAKHIRLLYHRLEDRCSLKNKEK